jgi:hypothetical protein
VLGQQIRLGHRGVAVRSPHVADDCALDFLDGTGRGSAVPIAEIGPGLLFLSDR